MTVRRRPDSGGVELRRFVAFAAAWLALGVTACLLVARTVPDAFGLFVPGVVIGNRRWAWRGGSCRLSAPGLAACVGYVLALVALGVAFRHAFEGFGR